jgi:hypothetical protein
MAANWRTMRCAAMGITSTGSGKRPSTWTCLLSSAMQTKRRACAATIFSRVSAAPPPLIMQPWPSISSAPSMYTASSPTALQSNTGMPAAFRPGGGYLGRRHRARDALLHRRQRIDEVIDRGARAHAHDLARLHVLQRAPHHGFEFVLRHLRQFPAV